MIQFSTLCRLRLA
ncbi:Leader peptide [Pseudomonas aeruginosa]|uniref:Leader peptide n=1 Tax=Pseudomonas aeruginosa (strain ATCC 15692 / DSM 22644 / CIP 104116 / JCM 14847 / LMG 12228 / 1C / PRS 101 / PAO1) TaxID=208964 RepID=E1JGK0_PSEAE|nr:leader peptide [Pseudomonas aeruginosa PAO1]CAI9789088.1 Leader peptide [Pseudomonas aeruginosa]SMZ54322.1 leader peptide [Pseudomonas aeruginosa C-NN2]VUY47849.1 leader peptide [Pseudomonas aeruginosa PAK]CAI9825139.1 Leader peptide [Pseudomonas aeruginosa]